MATACDAGEKLSIFAIGKSAKPRSFKNVKSLPSRYRSPVKSWMNIFFFDEWVKKLNKKFEKKIVKLFLL